MPGVLSKMSLHALLAVIGIAFTLALVFPRPAKKPKADKKYYAQPPGFIVPVNILNQIGRAFSDFLGVKMIKPNTDELLAIAASAPKSDLFGPQGEILVGIKKFMKGFAESEASTFGTFANNRYRRINLQKRTQLMEYIVRNPKIADIEIRRPIIITGMMRTGSTLLFNLLNQDPNARSPFLWEMAGTTPNPTPPPTGPFNDPRIEAVDKAIGVYGKVIPSLMADSAKSHFTGAKEIEECLFILIHQFIHQVILPVSGREYLEWFLNDKNKEYAYIYLRRYLQMLQSGYAPKSHWALKAPVHSLYVSHLLKVFPDAIVVVTHRDPNDVVPSTCKLMELGVNFNFGENTLDRRWVGECAFEMSATMCDRIMEYREQHGSDSFVDVRYPDLMDDPIKVVKEIYKKAGHQYTDEFEQNMQKYIKDNPQGKHGRNSYNLDIYGLTEEKMSSRFGKYKKTYNI